MEVKEYLESRIENCSKYTLTDNDRLILDNQGIEEFIFRKLMSKKYRKWSLPEYIQQKIKDVIHARVLENKRIKLDLSFGGFKLWRMPTAPEVDWGEFFSIAYFASYVAPIVAAYRPGIYFDFSSADITVTAVNNVPRKDVDQYYKSFKKLLGVFHPHFPDNLSMDITRLRDLFVDEEEFLKDSELCLAGARKRFADDPDYADEFHRGAIQNVQLKGGAENLALLSEKELEKRRQWSSEVVESMYNIPRIAQDENQGDISLMATNLELPIPMITTGTTKRSSAKFWSGMGVLAKDKDRFAEYVITLKQLEVIENQEHETISIDLFPLKNFEHIMVFSKPFQFTR